MAVQEFQTALGATVRLTVTRGSWQTDPNNINRSTRDVAVSVFYVDAEHRLPGAQGAMRCFAEFTVDTFSNNTATNWEKVRPGDPLVDMTPGQGDESSFDFHYTEEGFSGENGRLLVRGEFAFKGAGEAWDSVFGNYVQSL